MQMPATMVRERNDATFDDEVARLLETASEASGGGDAHGGETEGGDGRPAPARAWPVVPAIVAVGIVAALLTAFGMLTQIWANLSGAQLPGS